MHWSWRPVGGGAKSAALCRACHLWPLEGAPYTASSLSQEQHQIEAFSSPHAGNTAPVFAAAVSLAMATGPLKLQVCRAARRQWHELAWRSFYNMGCGQCILPNVSFNQQQFWNADEHVWALARCLNGNDTAERHPRHSYWGSATPYQGPSSLAKGTHSPGSCVLRVATDMA